MKYHPKTNSKNTIRPARIYMNDEEQEIADLKQELTDLCSSDEDNDKNKKCIFMVRVNRKIRQCKHIKAIFSDFCTFHDDEILYPFGLKKIKNDENDYDLLYSDEN